MAVDLPTPKKPVMILVLISLSGSVILTVLSFILAVFKLTKSEVKKVTQCDQNSANQGEEFFQLFSKIVVTKERRHTQRHQTCRGKARDDEVFVLAAAERQRKDARGQHKQNEKLVKQFVIEHGQ